MSLDVGNDDFVADTANYFPDQYGAEFVDPGFCRTGKSRDFVIRDQKIGVPSIRVPESLVNVSVPYWASAVVAATIVFSQPTFAAETRPRVHKVDALRATTEAEQTVQLRKAVARLDHLSGKPDGWKGPNSVRMPDAIKAAATEFLRGYYSATAMIEPFIGLDADGDVTLFWKNEKLLMDLSISEDGSYSFYAETKNGNPHEANEVSASTLLPDELVALLKKHTA